MTPARSIPPRDRIPGPLVCGLLAAAVGLAPVTAQNLTEPPPPAPLPTPSRSSSLFSDGLLPDGAKLKRATIPTYDDDYHLASVMNAGELTVHTRKELRPDKRSGREKEVDVLDHILGTDLLIRFYNPARALTGTITMSKARFEPRDGMNLLTSEEPVSLVSDDLNVTGSALALDTRERRGFLHGPVTATATTTRSLLDTRTSMNAHPTRSAIAAAGALLMAAAPSPAQDKPPSAVQRVADARMTPEMLAQLAADKVSRADAAAAEQESAGTRLGEIRQTSAEADTTMRTFFAGAGLQPVATPPAAEESAPDVPRPPDQVVPPEKMVTTVTAKDGAYFDTTDGLLVFLGDVKVRNPQITLDGAGEVKIFLEPQTKKEPDDKSAAAEKPEAPRREITPEEAQAMLAAKLRADGKKEKGKGGGEFGDVKKLVATGPAVHIRYVSGKKDDAPIEAMAHTIVYDFKEGTILLEGGSPWAIQEGTMRAEAVGKGAYILIHADDDGKMTKVVTHNPGGGFNLNLQSDKSGLNKDGNKKDKPAPNR